MKSWIKWIGGSVAFALLVITYSTCNSYKQDYNQSLELMNSMQDSINYFKNKQGESVAQIATLKGSREELLNAIGKKDKNLARLIRQNARAGAAYSQTTIIDTVVLARVDTVNGSRQYSSSINNEWIDMQLKLRDDSLHTNIQLTDRVTVSFKDVRTGFLKPKKSVVEVTNANPYVKVDGLRSFEVPKKKSKAKFWIGAGIGLGAGYLLFK